MRQLQVGSTVQLKTGGPIMTVDHIAGEFVKVLWFEGTTLMNDIVLAETLDVVILKEQILLG